MSKHGSKVSDRTRIGSGCIQPLIQRDNPTKYLPNNDELSLDSRSHGTLVSVTFRRNAAHHLFNRSAYFKKIL